MTSICMRNLGSRLVITAIVQRCRYGDGYPISTEGLTGAPVVRPVPGAQCQGVLGRLAAKPTNNWSIGRLARFGGGKSGSTEYGMSAEIPAVARKTRVRRR